LTAQSKSVQDIVQQLDALIGGSEASDDNAFRPNAYDTRTLKFQSPRKGPIMLKPSFRSSVTAKAPVHSEGRGRPGSGLDRRSTFPLDDPEFKEF
jgi:hypothetical protein